MMHVDETEAECSVCFSRSMAVINGALVCTVCGFQARAFTEEQDDDGEFVGSQPMRRTQRTLQATVGLKGRAEEVFSEAQIATAYCTCLQESLSALCLWFQEELRLDGVFSSICKTLWRAVLTGSGAFEPDFLAERKKEEHGEEPDEDDAPAALRELRVKLHRVLHPSVLLAILLLANVMLRTAVMPTDLVGLALSGKLPFFSTLAERGSDKDPNDRMQLLSFFRRTYIRGALDTMAEAVSLASKLQLRLPPVNAEAVLQRYCHDLTLPLEACAGAQAVLGVYRAGGLRLELTTARHPAPYLQLMAMLVYAVRAEYQEGGGRRRLPLGFDWGVWARRVLGRASTRQPPGLQADGQLFGDIDASLAALKAGLGALVQHEPDVRDAQASLRSFWEEGGSRTAAPSLAAQPGVQQEHGQAEYELLVIAAASVVWCDPQMLHLTVHHMQQEMAAVDQKADKL